MDKDVIIGKESRDVLIEGINKLCNTVKVTLGPSGKTVVISDEYGNPYNTKDGVSISNKVFLQDVLENMGATMAKEVAQKTVELAGDGPQPLYSKILTPTGFTTMKDIKIGDTICGTNNSIQKVLGVFDKGEKEVYEIEFSGGRKVHCSKDHLWSVSTNSGKKITAPISELIKDYKKITKRGYNNFKYYTPKTSIYFKENKNLLLDPYLIGVLLGDGSLKKNGSIEISIGYDKEHIINKLKLPEGFVINVKNYESKNYYRLKISGRDKDGNTIHDIIDKIDLLNVSSATKFIPNVYLYNSIEVREQLLQGLLDTDGYITKRGLFEFSTVSDKLKDDIIHLSQSLGIFTYYRLHMRTKEDSSYSDGPIHRVNQLKGYKYGEKVLNISKIDKIEPMRCISVSNSDNLYITDDFIVTHNTTTSLVLLQAFIKEGIKFLDDGGTYNEIKFVYDKLIPEIIGILKKESTPLRKEDIVDIATVSSNNDKKVGKLISKAFSFSDNVIVEAGIETEDKLDKVSGIIYKTSYFNKGFITDESKLTATLDEPAVLIIDGKLKDIDILRDVMMYCNKNQKPLVIISELIEENVLHLLETNQLNGALQLLPIKSPGFANHRKELLKDISIFTDSKVVTNLNKLIPISVLGELKLIETDVQETIMTPLNAELLEKHLDNLHSILETDLDKHSKTILKERIDNLKGSLCIIKVGGKSDIEVKERFDRIEDAVQAVKSALEEGIIPGGGLTLFKIANEAGSLKDNSNIIYNAIKEPNNVINENGADVHLFTFDDDTVIDPTKVTRVALENAASVALTILGTEALVINQNLWS